MAMRKIRYAVVGAGNIAQVAVLPAFAHATENSQLVAVVSSDEEKRRGLKRRYGLQHAAGYGDFEELLDSAEIDVAYIALPNHLHREFTERAARRGVHVLCEKPMATSVEDCEAMIRACEEHEVKLMIAYRLHFEPANLEAVEIVRSGRIGEPLLFSGTLTQQVRPGDIRTRAQVGGGALLDTGIYCLNAARYLFRDEPEEVFCFQNLDQDERFHDVDSTDVALLRFPHGRLAQLTTSQAAAGVSSFRVVGSQGDLLVDPAFTYHGERVHRLTVEDRTQEKRFERSDQFAPQLLYFSRCVLEDQEPEPSGWEGLADVRIITALLESARIGKAVKLEPFARRRRPGLDQLISRPAPEVPEPIHAPSPSE